MKTSANNTRLFLRGLILLISVTISAQTPSENREDNIEYHSTIDDEYIYVRLSTTDKPTMMAMLSRGFSVYFDVKGRKKRKVSVQYPAEVQLPPRIQGRNKETMPEEGPDIITVVEAMPKEARYTNPDYTEEFHLDINSLGISISYSYQEEGEKLFYELKMPKNKIADLPVDFSKLSIGVISTELDKVNERPQMSLGNGTRGGRGQSMGGGPGGMGGNQGSRGQRGMGNGPGNGGGPPQSERPEQVTIDFWFKANL